MWNVIGGLLLSASTSAAEMTRVERDAGYCAGNEETYCFEWIIPSLGNLRFIAHGDEDVIEYGFYQIGVNGYCILSNVLPVLEDASRPGQLFWGYPWDIADIKLTHSGERAALLGTFNHQLTSTDDDGVSINLSGKRAVLFVGRTTQPEAPVAPLQFEAVAPSEMGPGAN